MPKPWRLTRQAEASLRGVASWTLETFGARQAGVYEEDLIARCQAIADGTAPSQSCRSVIDRDLSEDLRFTRMGQHLIVFTENPDVVLIIDFVHTRRDLPSRLGRLSDRDG